MPSFPRLNISITFSSVDVVQEIDGVLDDAVANVTVVSETSRNTVKSREESVAEQHQ